MYQGRIVDILDPAEGTPERLGLLMGGSVEGGNGTAPPGAGAGAAAAPVAVASEGEA